MSDLASDLADYQAKDPDQALADAVAAVRSYCGWEITPSQSATVTVWSPDGRVVLLPTLNLTAVTSVTQDSALIAASEYTFESYGVIRRTWGSYFGKTTRVTVVFTHGYADWPDDVKGVILSLAQRQLADTRGLVPRVGGANASPIIMENYGAQLSEGDKAKLDAYAINAGFA